MKPCFAVILFLFCASMPACAEDADDLVRLAQSGVDEEVILMYIDQAPSRFDLSADDIINLKDLGVSAKVISEAIKHGRTDTINATVIDTEPPDATNAVASASQVVAPPPENLNISYFYEALDPYGIWRSVDDVWCWQPNATVMDYSWAPYCNHGHWTYTDWGWAWVSDYSWGWATFHYGRWFHHTQLGWLWVPGTEWAPAWVSFRTSPDYFGWAPLPPQARYVQSEGFYVDATPAAGDFEFGLTADDYSFVPAGNFYDSDPWEHVAPAANSNHLYQSTVVVKNNYTMTNNHMVNQGPNVSTVAKAAGKNIKPIAIVADDIKPGQPIHAGILGKDQLVMYKPVIAPVTPETPAAVKKRLTKSIAPTVNGQHAQQFQKRHTDARVLTVQKQQVAADSAEREKSRLEKAAGLETDRTKRASLKADATVAAMRAKEARLRAEKVEQWKEPDQTPLPKVTKPSSLGKDLDRSHRVLVKHVTAEAEAEKRKKQAQEDELKKQAESENQK